MRYRVSRGFIENQMRRGAMTERDYRNYRWKMRRKRELRNHVLILIFTICLVLGMVISFHSLITYAENATDKASFKYYKSIRVEYGDTLWSIAREYKDQHYNRTTDYIREVAAINHLSDDTIREGQLLVVPYYSNEYKK